MRTVFLTGATGAIGSTLARHVLDEGSTRLHLLIRATSGAHLQQRLQDLFRFWAISGRDGQWPGRVSAVAGDVSLPRLGLEKGIYDALTGEVTHVMHCAGNVKLNRPLAEARRLAVDSARHVLAFAGDCRRQGQPAKLEFVSTVGVAGRMRGIVPERVFTEAREYRNTYEEAKAEAERVVVEASAGGLPITIHRPSMVVGDSRAGTIIQFQVFYHLCEFLSGRRTGGFVPAAGDTRLDIIPVDYVAGVIRASSLRSDSAGRIFHLCSGPAQAPRIDDLSLRVRQLFATGGRRTPPLRRVPAWLIRVMLPAAVAATSGSARRALQGLPFFLEYLRESQCFANDATQAFFSTHGLRVPAVDTYLETVLTYYFAAQLERSDSSVAPPVEA